MQYRSSEIFGRKGKQLRAIYTIEQNHKSVGEERIALRLSRRLCTLAQNHDSYPKVYSPVYSKRNDWGGRESRRLHVASGNRPPPVIDFPSTRWSLEPVEIRLAFRTVAALPRRQIVVIKFHHGEGGEGRE